MPAKDPANQADTQSVPYFAPFPYYVKTKRKGRRTYESSLIKGIHHGAMPVADPVAIRPVFEVTHANGAKSRIDGWNGALWASFRDFDGRPMSIERFKEILTGKDIESNYPQPRIRLFDPFSSPLNWNDGEPWGGVLINGHISNNPDVAGAGSVEFDGGAEARARAAHVADRLAILDGAVCVKIPGPMWHIGRPEEARQRGDRSKSEVVLRPEWRIPMRCLDSHFRLQNSVADHHPGPLMAEGSFFAWNRKDDARAMAVRPDGAIVEEGTIEVLDRDLALELTRPGDDFAASASHALMPIVEEVAKQVLYLSDQGVSEWTAVRRAARELSNIWFGDADVARRGFRALEALIEEFEEGARNKHTSAVNIVSLATPAMRRWREFEKPAAMAADVEQAMAPDDEHAIATMRA